ncbi:MAG: NAD(P)/FAD-dependent oxidoreductase [Bacilli bacterium]|nr:NAD(P)/FAD-dependent oxidoreductase [Bacilli bacterium]MBQ9731308.1 NAD(P)/FAD-dependent oxidoreductase [Bacilli bacterium]
MKITIIGAGLGGLTFGALAAKDGHQVTIIDKNNKPGGVVALLEHEGYKFEQGPLLVGDMLEGEPVYEFLKSLGIELETIRADRDTIMPDYEMVTPKEYKGPYWRKERLKELFPEESKGIDKYYKFYDTVMHFRYLTTQPKSLGNTLQQLWCGLKLKKYLKMNADELTKYFFKSEKIRTLYTGILADFCADPSEAIGLSIVFTNFETAFDKRIPLYRNGKKYYPGFCYVKGGCQKIPEALADYITSHGGNFIYNTIVDKVIVEDKVAKGVVLKNGETIESDVVVGCGAGKDFFFETVGKEHLNEEYINILNTFRPMEAVFMLHLGVDMDPNKYMRSSLSYCYGMYDLHSATEKLRSGIYHEGDDGYLIFIPSNHADDFAPEGHHCVTIYTVAPDTLKEASWEDKKQEYAEKLIKLAERQLPNLSKHIKSMKIMTAVDYQKYTHMKKSSFGGVVPIWNQKNPPHITPVKGLYFVGQQSENAGGLGAVILGAKQAYEKALK